MESFCTVPSFILVVPYRLLLWMFEEKLGGTQKATCQKFEASGLAHSLFPGAGQIHFPGYQIKASPFWKKRFHGLSSRPLCVCGTLLSPLQHAASGVTVPVPCRYQRASWGVMHTKHRATIQRPQAGFRKPQSL